MVCFYTFKEVEYYNVPSKHFDRYLLSIIIQPKIKSSAFSK